MSDNVAVRARVTVPVASWPVSQVARMVMQECGIDSFSVVHGGNHLTVEAWYQPTDANEERWGWASTLVLRACLFVTQDKEAHDRPLQAARSCVDHCLVLFFANRETF